MVVTPADVWWAVPQTLGASRLRALQNLLDRDERARAERFAAAADRDAFVAAHGLLRLALSAHAARPPDAWRFRTDAAGKPALTGSGDGSGLAFSLAHARAIVACCVVRASTVGVDVEPVATAAPDDALIATCCAPAEQTLLAGLAPAERAVAFARLWTLKEAVLKALGVGLALAPTAVECVLDPPRLVRLAYEDAEAAAWELSSFVPAGGLVLAVARPATAADRPLIVEQVN